MDQGSQGSELTFFYQAPLVPLHQPYFLLTSNWALAGMGVSQTQLRSPWTNALSQVLREFPLEGLL